MEGKKKYESAKPAIEYNDDVLGRTGGRDVPGTEARVVIRVEARKVDAPHTTRVQPKHSPIAPEVLPPAATQIIMLVTYKVYMHHNKFYLTTIIISIKFQFYSYSLVESHLN